MATQIIYKNKDSQNKKDLIEKINCMMNISVNDLLIFFATEYGNNKHDDLYNQHQQGFYVDLERQKIPWPAPNEIESFITVLKTAKHFVWISRKICESEDTHFTWVYSHELQHLKQSLQNHYLLIVADLLKEVTNNYYDVPEVDLPTEFDCEKKAKEIVIKSFGKDECISYLRKMKANSPADDKRYSKLLELDITTDFDVEQEIQKDTCKNKERLKNIQEQIQNNEHVNWHIDIEKLCSIKDPHEAIMTSVTKISLSKFRGHDT